MADYTSLYDRALHLVMSDELFSNWGPTETILRDYHTTEDRLRFICEWLSRHCCPGAVCPVSCTISCTSSVPGHRLGECKMPVLAWAGKIMAAAEGRSPRVDWVDHPAALALFGEVAQPSISNSPD